MVKVAFASKLGLPCLEAVTLEEAVRIPEPLQTLGFYGSWAPLVAGAWVEAVTLALHWYPLKNLHF